MRIVILSIALLFFSKLVFGACDKPRLPEIVSLKQERVELKWKDNNIQPQGYQLAHTIKGKLLKDAVRSEIFKDKIGQIENLISGNSYLFWIRTVCSENDTSKWEGPFSFTTLIRNPSRCGLDLDIKDNSCESPSGGDDFLIDVNGITGQNNFLESVSLIISHGWPADLKISIENPQGISAILSNENGTLTDDFGINNELCDRPCSFTISACNSIKDGSPPFAGSFEPEESLQKVFTSNPNGIWRLKICDGALNDKGVLRFVRLNFSQVLCTVPEHFYASRLTDKSFEVVWEKPENCTQMEIYFKKRSEQSFTKKQITTCSVERSVIENLEPNIEYDFYLVSECGLTISSSPSCIKSAFTLCDLPTLSENFDKLSVCENSCDLSCNFNSNFLFNSTKDDLDWVVNEGPTATLFTGPDEGALGGGRYVYIENNPSLCGAQSTAVLETKCIKTTENPTTCDLSFYYHMLGKDIGSFKVLKSLDNGSNWETVINVPTLDENKWQKINRGLNIASGNLFKLKFEAITKDGAEGDLAIDQINMNNIFLSEENTFYVDRDNDGYGIRDSFIKTCITLPPFGYARQFGDCNDNDNLMNPGVQDRPCNLIDENCDGKLELKDLQNPMNITSLTVKDESCKGKKDGKISIGFTGGTFPYTFDWGAYQGIDSLVNISSGFYKCKITDVNGCGIESNNIEVKTTSNFNVSISSVIKSSCKGVKDGAISLINNGNFPPFTYRWSNLDTSPNLFNIRDGKYSVTVTDNVGCNSELKDIEVGSKSTLNVVNSFVKHPLCFGQSTGILDFDVIGGINPIKYTWSDGNTNKRRENLPSGIYPVTVMDAKGCSADIIGKINAPDSMNIRIVNIEDIRCFGSSSGQIKIKTSGGIEPYNYSWNDGYLQANRNNIKANTYSVTVYDSNGCKASYDNIKVNEEEKLTYVVDSIKNASCLKKSDGAIYTKILGGVKPYNFYWSTNLPKFEVHENLLPSNYALTVVDANNCKLTTDAISVLNNNQSFLIDINVLEKLKCPSKNDAAISVTIDDVTYPLDFNWSNGVQNIKNVNHDTLKFLEDGKYNVTVTDAESCVSISENVIIEGIPSIDIALEISINKCNNDESGSILSKVSGANPPYTYQWSNGENKPTISNLKNGNYILSLEDKNGCKFTSQEVIVSSISDIKLEIITTDTEIGKSNGKAMIIASGGKGLYNIIWEDITITGLNPINLKEGNYKFTIIDELNCEVDSLITIKLITNVKDIDIPIIEIYPNPNNGVFYINTDIEIKQVILYSLDGRSIEIERNLNEDMNGVKIINQNNLPSAYVLKLIDVKGRTYSKKIIHIK